MLMKSQLTLRRSVDPHQSLGDEGRIGPGPSDLRLIGMGDAELGASVRRLGCKWTDYIGMSSSNHHLKRPRSTSPGLGSVKSSRQSDNHVFMTMTRLEGSFEKVSPFYIQKCLEGVAGSLKTVKRLRNGTLLLETSYRKQVNQLLKCEKLGEFAIKCERHLGLNRSKGVIVCRDLIDLGSEELLKEWERDKVVAVQQISRRVNGELQKSATFILTFDSPSLPKEIKAGFLNLPVRLYVPPPMRCFQCQRFGHTTASCGGKPTCGKCGSAAHEAGNECTKPPVCINCSGPHPVWSKDCAVYLEEQKIQEIKVAQRLPYVEAKRQYKALAPPVFAASFAKVVLPTAPKVSVGTQTSVSEASTSTACSCEYKRGAKAASSSEVRPLKTTLESIASPTSASTSDTLLPPPQSPVIVKESKKESSKLPKENKTDRSQFLKPPESPQVESKGRKKKHKTKGDEGSFTESEAASDDGSSMQVDDIAPDASASDRHVSEHR